MTATWQALEADARAQLSHDGFEPRQIKIERTANMHYKGQIFELSVAAPDGVLDDEKVRALEERFGQEHERTYGHRAGPDEPVVLVTAQLIGRGLPDHESVPDRLITPADGEPPAATKRPAYFGPDQGWLETDVIPRALLVERRSGPLIVEEYDATCIIPPGACAVCDDYGNIVVDMA